jgi:hypothetical protein
LRSVLHLFHAQPAWQVGVCAKEFGMNGDRNNHFTEEFGKEIDLIDG